MLILEIIFSMFPCVLTLRKVKYSSEQTNISFPSLFCFEIKCGNIFWLWLIKSEIETCNYKTLSMTIRFSEFV